MGRKILMAVACWLALSRADGLSAQLEDNVAEASLPRLYRSIPAGVYASAAPYASFSFHVPTFARTPKLARLGPLKQESVVVENKQGFLKDSYGNKFVQSPQSLPYRMAFPQQYVQLQDLPAHLAQPLLAASPSFEYKQLSPHFFGPADFKVQAVQTVSPSTSNRYAINQPYDNGAGRPALQQHPTNNVEKSQRLDDHSNGNGRHNPRVDAVSHTNTDEKNAEYNHELKPSVPLLDLSLLEPLTFDNPLVPQVQHFLPRISSATYHKLPQINVDEIKSKVKEIMIQGTKSYDNRDEENASKLKSSRQQQQRPHSEDDSKRDKEDRDDVPKDDSYEINSPNYQEFNNEKFVNYNKETQSEPINYSYEMKYEKEPLSYNYVRTTKEPYREQVKNENQNTKDNDQYPKHLIYKFTPEENDDEKHNNYNTAREESESPEEINEQKHEHKQPVRLTQHKKDESYETENYHHRRPEKISTGPRTTSEKDYHEKGERNHKPHKHSQIETLSVDNRNADKQIVLHEHEENIRIIPQSKKYEAIKVDPNQHIQQENLNSREHEDNADDPPRDQPHTHQREQYSPEVLVEEKPKHVIISEDSGHGARHNSKVNNEGAEKEGKREEEFENRYKNTANSFPAFEPKDTEKEIYNPEPYAPSRYQNDFDVELSPFQRYVAESDEFPKSTRSNYKDARDKTKDSYYLDYALSKPESMLARFQQKEDYYKTYMHRRPQYVNDEDEGNKKSHKKNAKYSAAPAIEYFASAQKPKQYYANYKAGPRSLAYVHQYAKEGPKDNSAYASGSYQRLKTPTQFVEPQFQYGFEPSVLPLLLDSELAAMASNIRSQNEEPLMRKKVYKENWYIKKTSSNGRKATS